MGWIQVWQTSPHPILRGVPNGNYFHFAPGFHGGASDARHSAGETEYGVCFTPTMAHDNIFATQIHPEKCVDTGLALYRNFLSWDP